MIQCIQEPRPKRETLHIHYHYHDQISSLNNSQLPAAGSPQPAARSRSTAFYHHCRSCLSRAGFYASPVHSTKMFQALQQHCQHSQLEVSRKLEVGKLDPRSVWTGQVCHGIAAACQTSPTNLITPDGEGWIDPSISPRPSGISTSTSSDSGSTWKLQAGGSSWELLYQMSHACHAWCQET